MTTTHPPSAPRLRKIPYDLDAARGVTDWRQILTWPVPPHLLHTLFQRSLRTYLEFIGCTDDEFTRRLLLACPGLFLGYVWGYYEKVLCLQAESEVGVYYTGGGSELAYLRSGEGEAPSNKQLAIALRRITAPRYPPLRHLLNTAQWTPMWKLPRALLAPDAIAISRNSLLVDWAKDSPDAIRYYDSSKLLSDARRLINSGSRADKLARTTAQIIALFTKQPEFREPYVSRLGNLIGTVVKPVMRRVAQDMECLEALGSLPSEIWSGTAGQYPSRVIGLEVLRRGGRAVRFDHGGATGICSPFEAFTLIELCAASRFVMATPTIAEMVSGTITPNIHTKCHGAEIVGARGFPHLRDLSLTHSRARGRRRRVMYLVGSNYSGRKNTGHTMSEIVYADWSFRLAESLAALPIELVIKPHPDAVPRNGDHALAAVATTIYEPFEDVMDTADVYVFDILHSTTFWEAVCSDRPVVYVDLGCINVMSRLEPLLHKRCRVIRARYDCRNRPQIAEDELADAVASGPDRADPDDFRHLFMDPA